MNCPLEIKGRRFETQECHCKYKLECRKRELDIEERRLELYELHRKEDLERQERWRSEEHQRNLELMKFKEARKDRRLEMKLQMLLQAKVNCMEAEMIDVSAGSAPLLPQSKRRRCSREILSQRPLADSDRIDQAVIDGNEHEIKKHSRKARSCRWCSYE